MYSAWEFVKKNKGKIATVGILLGGSAAVLMSNRKGQMIQERPHAQADISLQARKHYVFDSAHRSCDQSISELVKSINQQIQTRFNLEQITSRLEENENMTPVEKLELWERLKLETFCRIVSIAYGYSILTLALKAQISILAADTCINFENKHSASITWSQYLPESIRSFFVKDEATQTHTELDIGNEAGDRRVFLQCIQFFTVNGIPKLMDRISDAVTDEMKNLSLRDRRTKEDLRYLFDKISSRINDKELISQLVAPVEPSRVNSSDNLLHLVMRLTKNLQSSRCFIALNSLIDFYFSASLKMIDGDSQPLAKYLPQLSNAYPTLASTAFDSPLFDSLYSSDVHQFAVFVFDS